MRIPSFSKIDLQAKEYAKNHGSYITEEDLALKIILEEEQSKWSEEWGKLRDSFCFATDPKACICSTHPRHKEFMDILEPINRKLKDIYVKANNSYAKLLAAKRRELLLARSAKLKYLKE